LPQRCSRPLCSSQSTGNTPPQPPRTPTRAPYKAAECRTKTDQTAVRTSKSPFPQDPTVCLHPQKTHATTFHPTTAGVLAADAHFQKRTS